MLRVISIVALSLLAISCNRSLATLNIANEPSPVSRSSDLTTIMAGHGTKSVYLGESRAEIIHVLGKPLNIMERSEDLHCYETSLQWIDSNEDGSLVDGNGIIAFLRNNKVVELYFSAKKYKTGDGITYGSSLSNASREMRALPILGLTRSSSEATNGKDKQYVINESAGLAYLIEGHNKVSAIYVFEPKTQFQPSGCLSSDQKFYEK